MNSNQLMSIFIIVVMVGSILGFSILYTGGRDETPSPTNEPSPFDEGTILNMDSGPVEGKIIELLPKILFSAGTDEAEINEIDALLYSINGIYRIDSRYRQNTEPSISGALIYIAEISFDDSSISAEELMDAIRENTEEVLFGQEAYKIVLVSIPKEVEFTEPDLNLTRTHVFDEPLTQAYVTIDSLKGDEIEIIIRASFSGKALVSSIAYLNSNITASPEYILLEKDVSIDSLKDELFFSVEMNYSSFLEEDELKERILSLEGINELELNLSLPQNYISIEITDENASSFTQDLNSFLTDFNGIVFFSFEENELFEVFAAFEEEFNLNEFKTQFSEKLTSLELQEFSFIESKGIASGDIDFSGEVLTATDSLEFLFNSLSFEEAMIFQKGSTTASFLTDPETEKEYLVEEGSFELFLPPGHSVGETISVEIRFTGVRDKATAIEAVEVK